MRRVKITEHNSAFFRFKITDNELYQEIKDFFSYEIQIWQNKRPKQIIVNMIKHSAYLYRGLLKEFIHFLEENGVSYDIDKSLTVEHEINRDAVKDFIDGLNLTLVPHEYQLETVYKILTQRNITVHSPTSSGKSLIIAIAIALFLAGRKNDKRVLVVVPDKNLVRQMYNDILGYFSNSNLDIKPLMQMIHSGIPKPERNMSAPIIITTWQSQKGTDVSYLSDFNNEFLAGVGCLIYDEVHESTAKVAKNIVMDCVNTDFRIGTTGTLHDTEDEYKNTEIRGLFGDVFSSISTTEMIAGGYATPVEIFHLLFYFGKHTKKNYHEELEFVESSDAFVDYISSTISKAKGGNSIVLFRSLKYGRRLMKVVKGMDKEKSLFMITGSTPMKRRKEIFEYIKTHDNCVLFGTYKIISTGLSIPSLHRAFLAQSMKKKIKTVQALGRILRLYGGKEKALVVDFVPVVEYAQGKFLKKGYLFQHFENRNKVYKAEGHDPHIEIIKSFLPFPLDK